MLLTDARQPHLVIDFDKPESPAGRSSTRCDYLFIADGSDNRGWVAPMEFKDGQMKVSGVVNQLRAGAHAARQFVSKGNAVNFRPVAVVHGIRSEQRRELREENNQVQFHQHREHIRVLICDDRLTEELLA